MKAAVVTDGGLQVREVEKPTPGPEQVLVRVRAAGLNRADLQVAAGRSHGTIGGAGTIVGLEFAGEVQRFGQESGRLVEPSGSQADQRDVIRLPGSGRSVTERSQAGMAVAQVRLGQRVVLHHQTQAAEVTDEQGDVPVCPSLTGEFQRVVEDGFGTGVVALVLVGDREGRGGEGDA